LLCCLCEFFFSSRRRHTRSKRDWSSDVCSSDLGAPYMVKQLKEYKAGVREDATMFGMTAALSEQDMEDLAAYFASQTIKVGAADPELVEEGERLYRGGNIETGIAACAACHGPAGEGIN